MNINLRQLRAFASIGQLASFTKAASVLHTSQPALSAQIQQLEDALGLRLFDRSTRSVALTQAGAALLPVVENGFVNLDDQKNFVENPAFRGLGWRQLAWAWTTRHLGVHQPLSWMVFEAEYAACGLDARGYHLTSLALYVLVTITLYVLTRALIAREEPVLRAHDISMWGYIVLTALVDNYGDGTLDHPNANPLSRWIRASEAQYGACSNVEPGANEVAYIFAQILLAHADACSSHDEAA